MLMLRTLYLYVIAVFIIIAGISCESTKKIAYLHDVGDTTFIDKGANVETPIRANDILSIIISSANAQASEMFNQPTTNVGRSTTVTGTFTETGGYLVDGDGNIQLTALGTIKAAGLTEQELKDNITNLLLSKKLLIDPVVEIRFLNFEVTVIGEVAKPTVITVPNEKISLLKALGLAGDLTIYGKRDNVLLIREENGKKITRHIDLSSSDFLNSPYYYLQPNDIIYVEPNKARVAASGRSQQLLPVIISSLSVVAIVVDRLVK